MSIQEAVYWVIGWFSFIAFFFILMIIYISRFELRNSKKSLNLRLAMHYHHQYHLIYTKLISFRQKIVSKFEDDTMSNILKQHSRSFQEQVPLMSEEIYINCEKNDFSFIKSKGLKVRLIEKSDKTVEVYRILLEHLSAVEEQLHRMGDQPDEEQISMRWKRFEVTFNRLTTHVIDLQSLIASEVYVDVIEYN